MNRKLELDLVVKKINEKYAIDLEGILKSEEIGDKSLYIYLYILADNIRKEIPEIYGIHQENDVSVPYLNVNKFAEALDINICNMPFPNYPYLVSFYDEWDGVSNDRKLERDIYNNAHRFGPMTERYSDIRLMAYYIIMSITKQKMGTFQNYSVKISVCSEYRWASILASYLILPMEDALEFMRNYTLREEKKSGVVNIYELSRSIAYYFFISDYDEVICFEHMSYLIEILYNYNGKLPLDDICSKVRSYNDLVK